ncbi:MAG: thiamine pyrophosphate-binding protein [Chloroflexi bacterium]|nr:thiamine pyrophosphate-binding protein [Chloroflexota bacterium]
MEWLSGGEALVKALYQEGVRVVFGLPGVQLYGVLAALREEPRIRFITTRHEQATSYMADGYARAGGRFGTALVVPGPGLLNAAAGLSTAYAASSPVLMISGQVPRAGLGKKIGLLHEVDDQQDAIAPITKWRRRVLEVEDIPAAVRDAVGALRAGRPRPVELEFPPDTLEGEGEVELLPPQPVEPVVPPSAALDQAADVLQRAQRPLIYAGGGVHAAGAHELLAALVDRLQAPVLETAEGKGAVSDRNPLSLGAAYWPSSPVVPIVRSADVVLAVGTRLASSPFTPEQRLIQIDADPEVLQRAGPGALTLLGDARATLEQLDLRLRGNGARPSLASEVEEVRTALAHSETLEPQASILRSLRAGTPDDAIFISGMTQIGYYSRLFWPVYEPRTYLTSSYSGNLGYEYPLALGARVARPDRPVVATVGDGGFLYNSQEMATAVQFGINLVVVVFNDNAYGNVARDLDESWGGAYASELRNPDLMKLADAYGVFGLRASEPTDVGRLVAEAIQQDRPALVEVPVGRMPRPTFFPGVRAPKKYQR